MRSDPLEGVPERLRRGRSERLPRRADSLEPRDERARPAVDVVADHALAQRSHARPALVLGHRERAVERGGRLLHVVRVHEQRLRELCGGGARELGQHEHAVAVGAGSDELLRDEVHPIAQRRDEHRVGGAVQGDDLVLRQPAVQVMDGRPRRRREFPVDAPDERVHLLAVLAISLDVLPGGDGDLHEPDALAQLGVRAASPRTRAAGADPLRVVEPVDADEQLSPGPRCACATARILRAAAISSNWAASIPIGNTPRRTPRAHAIRSTSVDAPSSRSTDEAKWRTYVAVWKPTRSAPSSPSSIRSRCGSMRKISEEGNGMWRKNLDPRVRVRDLGRAAARA